VPIVSALHWLRGKIFRYSKYKAWNEGIVTSRVNPRNTSRDCARCGAKVARYHADQPAEGYTPGASLAYCPICRMYENADRNASIVVGKRLLARYQQTHCKEKPHAPLRRAGRSVKTGGVTLSQKAIRVRGPSPQYAWQGASNAVGTPQAVASRMGEHAAPIPHQLRLFNESSLRDGFSNFPLLLRSRRSPLSQRHGVCVIWRK
jgi:hypothetical protein